MNSIRDIKQPKLVLAIFAAIVFSMQVFLQVSVPANGDEVLFWEHGNHLAWGYYSHPPMVGFIIRVFTDIFGNNTFGLRFASALMYLGNLLIAYCLINRIVQDSRKTMFGTILFGLFNLPFLMGVAITTDVPMFFFYNLSLFYFYRAIIEDDKKSWYLAGFAAGMMSMSKMLSILVFPGLFIFLVLNKEYRKYFARKEPYIGALIMFIIYSPFLWWNYNNDWLNFQFQFVIRTKEKIDLLNSFGVYWLCIFGALSPFVFYQTGKLIFVSFKSKSMIISERIFGEDRANIFFLYIALGAALFYLGLSFKSLISFHWFSVILLPLAVSLTVFWFKGNGNNISRNFYWAYLSQFIFIVPFVVIALFPKYILPNSVLYIDAPGEHQKLGSEIFGVPEVAAELEKIQSELSSEHPELVLAASSYSLAGLLKFYMPSHPQFVMMDTTNATHAREFIQWEVGFKKLGGTILMVSDYPNPKRRLEPFTEKVTELPNFVIRDDRNGKILRIFYMALGENYLGGENSFLNNRKN